MQLKLFRWSQIALPALTAFWLAGCASTPQKSSHAALEAVHLAAAEIENEYNDLNDALASLDGLIHQPERDLRPQFAAYSDAVDRLYDSIMRAEKAVNRMKQKNVSYFALWDQRIGGMNYEVTRQYSKQRRAAVQKQFHAMEKRYTDTREVMLPLLAYLEDIRKLLQADLSIGGVEALKELAEKAIANGRKVETALETLAMELAESGNQVAQHEIPQARPRKTAQKEEQKPVARSGERTVGVGGWFKSAFAKLVPGKKDETANAGGSGDEVISAPPPQPEPPIKSSARQLN